MIRLFDGKGRRAQPRAPYVPQLPEAEAALLAMAPRRQAAADDESESGPFLFTVTEEKRATLEALHRLLTQPDAAVTPIRHKAQVPCCKPRLCEI